MKTKLKNLLRNRYIRILFFVIAFAFAINLFLKGSSQLAKENISVNYLIIVLSLMVAIIGYIPAFYGWRKILDVFQLRGTWKRDLRIYLYPMMGVFLPGGFWHIIGRSIISGNDETQRIKTASASVLETIFIGLAGAFTFLVGRLFNPKYPEVDVGPLPYIAIGIVIVLLEPHIFNKVIKSLFRILKIGECGDLSLDYSKVIQIIVLEMVMVIIGGSAIYVLLCGLVAFPPISAINIIASYGFSVFIGNLFFWLPGRVIIKDGSFMLALSAFVQPSEAVVFVLIVRIWYIFTIIIPISLVWTLAYARKIYFNYRSKTIG